MSPQQDSRRTRRLSPPAGHAHVRLLVASVLLVLALGPQMSVPSATPVSAQTPTTNQQASGSVRLSGSTPDSVLHGTASYVGPYNPQQIRPATSSCGTKSGASSVRVPG